MNLHLHKTVFVNMGEKIDLGRGAPGQQGVGVESSAGLGKASEEIFVQCTHTLKMWKNENDDIDITIIE